MATTTPAAPAVPTKEQAEQAYAVLFDKVAGDVFFHRLAAHGITPKSEKEAHDLLQINAMLASAEQQQQKTGGDSRFGGTLQRLAGTLGFRPEDTELNHGIKVAAEELFADPEIYRSVACLRQFEAAARG